ncbi:MAG: element excision factor XisI family protein [Pyrinomonadaceae bacterium]
MLQAVVNRHAKFQPANGQITTHAICDPANGDYMVVDSGWNEKGRRIYDVVLHFRLQNDKIYVERDNTDAEIVRELLEAGIDSNSIVLAFNALPFQRLDDLAMV